MAYKLIGIIRVKNERVTTYRFLILTWLRNIIWLKSYLIFEISTFTLTHTAKNFMLNENVKKVIKTARQNTGTVCYFGNGLDLLYAAFVWAVCQGFINLEVSPTHPFCTKSGVIASCVRLFFSLSFTQFVIVRIFFFSLLKITQWFLRQSILFTMLALRSMGGLNSGKENSFRKVLQCWR